MSKKPSGGTKPTSSQEIQAQDELGRLALSAEGRSPSGTSVPPPPPPGQATASPPFASAAAATSASSPEQAERPVIAVSASKGPAAFFNLARKFLATNDMCDLSALEGAIVSAVDAAHLLERSKLAKITRIHTSYVIVEPKRKKQGGQSSQDEEGGSFSSVGATSPLSQPAVPFQPPGGGPHLGVSTMGHAHPPDASSRHAAHGRKNHGGRSSSGYNNEPSGGGREMRRARIIITVQRTEEYAKWLQENPNEAAAASADNEDDSPPSGPEHGSGPAHPSEAFKKKR